MMPMTGDQQTIRYISERRCTSGGYCFYRLDEPNAADTLYALASLDLLDEIPEDPVTRSYLHAFQHPDCSFSNVNVGHAVCRSLLVLGERPACDPAGWLLAAMIPPGADERPVESVSLFANLFFCVDLCTRLGIVILPIKGLPSSAPCSGINARTPVLVIPAPRSSRQVVRWSSLQRRGIPCHRQDRQNL